MIEEDINIDIKALKDIMIKYNKDCILFIKDD